MDEVRGRCPVFVDGGFSQGTDVFKALALGADLVRLPEIFFLKTCMLYWRFKYLRFIIKKGEILLYIYDTRIES